MLLEDSFVSEMNLIVMHLDISPCHVIVHAYSSSHKAQNQSFRWVSMTFNFWLILHAFVSSRPSPVCGICEDVWSLPSFEVVIMVPWREDTPWSQLLSQPVIRAVTTLDLSRVVRQVAHTPLERCDSSRCRRLNGCWGRAGLRRACASAAARAASSHPPPHPPRPTSPPHSAL